MGEKKKLFGGEAMGSTAGVERKAAPKAFIDVTEHTVNYSLVQSYTA